RDTEWLATFLGLSTDLPKGAPVLSGHLTVGFPEPRGNRTTVQGVVQLARKSLAPVQVEGQPAGYNLVLTGEILNEDALHESFRYRSDLPAAGQGATVPLTFERTLRRGDYTLIVRVEDLAGKQSFRTAQPLAVPKLAAAAPDPGVKAALGEARQELAEPAATLRLLPPPGEAST